MPNRLVAETSPYLLQHANNPVDWYPWGEEAIARARAEDRPIFLSIGYSACHWCHVMEHESFEDPAIAEQLNNGFVCIKVDREERPDLDQIYMHAVQILTGRGGWPMSVFLTSDLRPFYGGTYWPPRRRMGMPGFDEVLEAVLDAWRNRRDQVHQAANDITARIRAIGRGGHAEEPPSVDLLLAAYPKLERMFDFRHGGFGGAPKFPHPMDLQLLLRIWQRTGNETALEMVTLNLEKMAAGGIYDHLAGGFARYSVDERWLVPHFEKMLYDNALLTATYVEAFQVTARDDFARIARETCDYVLQYMTDPLGGFHSTEDADSEGEEGKFYLWTPEEIMEVLGPETGSRFCELYDVTSAGNFEGRNILNLPKSIEQFAALRGLNAAELDEEMRAARAKLLARRDTRIRPAKDDKILTSWNALMIEALARAGSVLEEPRYVTAAARAAQFILDHLRGPDQRLLHCWRAGEGRLAAYLDDYAYLCGALVRLYEATFEESWIDAAVLLADQMLEHFLDPQAGDFFYTADDHETLIARNKDYLDSSVPSGNGMAAASLIRLGHLTGRQEYLDAAHRTLSQASALIRQHPTASGQLLLALDSALGPFHEVVVAARTDNEEWSRIVRDARKRYWPRKVLAARTAQSSAAHSAHLDPLFAGKPLDSDTPAVYLCESFTCQAPALGETAAGVQFDIASAAR